MKNQIKLIVIGVLVLTLIFVFFYFTNTPYTPEKALFVSETFIDLMWHGSYIEGYELASISGSDWNTIEEFQNTWIELFPEEYRWNRSYQFYSNSVTRSGRIRPYQSLGNYFKRLLLRREPVHPEIIEVEYYIDARQKNEDFQNNVHCLWLKLQLENDNWTLLRFRKTAW